MLASKRQWPRLALRWHYRTQGSDEAGRSAQKKTSIEVDKGRSIEFKAENCATSKTRRNQGVADDACPIHFASSIGRLDFRAHATLEKWLRPDFLELGFSWGGSAGPCGRCLQSFHRQKVWRFICLQSRERRREQVSVRIDAKAAQLIEPSTEAVKKSQSRGPITGAEGPFVCPHRPSPVRAVASGSHSKDRA